MYSYLVILLLLGIISQLPTTHASLITTINKRALRSLIQNVRYQVLPNFIDLLNTVTDDTLSISTQIGSCCNRGDTGAQASVSISNLQINNQTMSDPILTTKSSSSTTSGSSNSEIATMTFQTRNIDIQSKITSAIAVSLGLGGSGISCQPSLRVFLELPQLSFNVDLVRGGTTTSTSSSAVGDSAYQVSMNALQIDPFKLYITVTDEGAGLCDTVLQPITNVLNQATSLLSSRITNRFQTLVTDYMKQYALDSIPVAFDVPVPMAQGELMIGLGLQSLQSTGNGILSVLGTSFTSTINNVEWRNQYTYNRALVDTTASVASDIATATSLLSASSSTTVKDDQLIQMKLRFPPLNNFMAAIHHQVWAGLATDADVVNHMEDFCPTTNDTTTTTTPIIDPCPFPPIRLSPFTIADKLALRAFFMGNNDFKYQTVIEPPVLGILSADTISTLADVVLQGRVPSKVVLRGKRTRISTLFRSLLGLGDETTNEERTIAALDVDIVFDMNLPKYNRDTGIIEWDDNGLSIRIENAASETRFQFFGNAFTNLATKFVNQFVARRLLTPINNGIRFGLEQIPFRIPSIQNLPLRNANIDFTFPNFVMNFENSDAVSIASDVSVDVTYPTAVMASDEEVDVVADTTSTIVTLAQEVFTSTTDDTIIMFTTVYEDDDDEGDAVDIAVTSRVTNNNDKTVTVEQYDNGKWVPV